MLELHHLLVVAVVVAVGYYVAVAVRLQENAYRQVQTRCEKEGVQLLDATIYLARIRVGRGHNGRWVIKRNFRFEFTVTGAERYPGLAQLSGKRIVSIDMAPHRMP